MSEIQPADKNNAEQPYRLYRDPYLPLFSVDPVLGSLATDMERAEDLLSRRPDSQQFIAGYTAAEESLRSYIDKQGYYTAEPPQEAPPTDIE
jgi:hypothetical protein